MEISSNSIAFTVINKYAKRVWAQLPCCFSKGPLKKDFLNIYLITFFGVRNFGNTSAMRVIFFLKIFKI